MEQVNSPLPTEESQLGIWVIVATFLFVVAQFGVGDLLGFMHNDRCFPVLGCNAGFFGYDALVHFIAGIAFAFTVVWLGDAYPRFRVVSVNFWKGVVIVIAICVLIETGWEIWEFGIDHVRMDVFHENLTVPNRLWQPSNSDTMGDETANLLGGAAAIALLALFKPHALRRREG